MPPKTPKKKTEKQTAVATEARKPSGQALQAVDVAVGAVPTVAEAVRNTADTWRDSETRSKEAKSLQKRVSKLRHAEARSNELQSLRQRLGSELEKAETKGGDVRRQVTDQLIGQARRARERVEPVYRERVEPVYRKRFEPAVNRVRERI